MKEQYRLEQDGFSARYYQGSGEPSSIIIVLSAKRNDNIAQAFTDKGFHTLALDMIEFGNEVSLDDISLAAQTMREEGFSHVGVWGFGFGATIALSTAAHYPNDFDLVMAISPFHLLYQPLLVKSAPISILFQGLPLPILKPESKVWKDVIKEVGSSHEFHTVDRFEQWLTHGYREEMMIPVENIHCPILLISSQNDTVLPSEYACRFMVRRLKDQHFGYGVRHIHYRMVSHMILPPKLPLQDQILYRRLFQIERNYPAHCQHTREDAFEKTLLFIHEKWPWANE